MTRTKVPKIASGIYQIQSKSNNKIYVGSAVNLEKRKQMHFWCLKKGTHHNIYLQRHYNKYGKEDLQFSILEFCAKENLIEREQFYIDTLNSIFNICKIASSTLGIKLSAEFKRKLSKARSGKNNPNYGKPISEEQKQKISKAHMGMRLSEATKNKIRKAKIGTHHSEETKLKMRLARIGKYAGEKHPLFGIRQSEETKLKRKATWKKKSAKKEEKQLFFKIDAA